jgi:hypothetical protein
MTENQLWLRIQAILFLVDNCNPLDHDRRLALHHELFLARDDFERITRRPLEL